MNVATRIEKSKHVSLILPPDEQENDTHLALMVACGLKKLGKAVSIEHTQPSLGTQPSKVRTFVVSLKGLAPWIAGVRYEKDASDLKLYFALHQGDIPPEALLPDIQRDADLTIIGGNKIRQNNDVLGKETPFISAADAKTPILELLVVHADPQTKLLGMVLSKLEYIPRLNIYVAVLPQENLRTMSIEPKHTPLVVLDLIASFGNTRSYLLLLESRLGAQGVLWSPSAQLRTKICAITGGQQKDSWVLLQSTPLSSQQLTYAFLS